MLQGLVDLGWAPLRALHVNHQLQADAARWAAEAVHVCAALGVLCTVRTVEVTGRKRLGTEAAARVARYAAFREELNEGEVLLLAHHADDQAETVLLQLLRGAGLEGLMGMAASLPLGRGRLARPLLDVPGDAIEAFARTRNIPYIVDPSNADTRYRRNFLRLEIMPRLRRHWPRAGLAIARSARQLQRAHAVWQADRSGLSCARGDGALWLGAWRALDAPQALHALRQWIRQQQGPVLSERSLLALAAALHEEPRSRQQRIALEGGVVRRYRDHAWWGEAAGEAPGGSRDWEPPAPFDWPEAGLHWSVRETVGMGLAQERLRGHRLSVRFREAGARAFIGGRGHRPVKKLLQELGVPPWRRAQLPLLWDGENLVAVAGIWIAPAYRARDGEPGWLIEDKGQAPGGCEK